MAEPNFTESKSLRDVVIRADGSVTAAYEYELKKDDEVLATDVKYDNYAAGETMTQDVYNLIDTASAR